jgi:hypothetical protein
MSKRTASGHEIERVTSIDLFAIFNFMFENEITDENENKTIEQIKSLSFQLIGTIPNGRDYRLQINTFFEQFQTRRFEEASLNVFRIPMFTSLNVDLQRLPETFKKILRIKGCNGTSQSIRAPENTEATLYQIVLSIQNTLNLLSLIDKKKIVTYMEKFNDIPPAFKAFLTLRGMENSKFLDAIKHFKEDVLLKKNDKKKSLPYSVVKAIVLYDEIRRNTDREAAGENKDLGDGRIDNTVRLGSYLWRLFIKKVENTENTNHLEKVFAVVFNKCTEIKQEIRSKDISETIKNEISESIDAIFLNITNEEKKQETSELCILLNSHTDTIALNYSGLSDFVHEFCRKSSLIGRLSKDQVFKIFDTNSEKYSFRFPDGAVFSVKDSVFDGRYGSVRNRTLDENLSKQTMTSIAFLIPQEAVRTIIAGGISVLLRYKTHVISGNAKVVRDDSNELIHSFSPKANRHSEKEIGMRPNDLITHKLNMREDKFKKIFDYEFYQHIGDPPSNETKRDNLKAALFKLKDKSNNERDEFVKLCESDILNAERILLFGMAVLFRGAVEVFREVIKGEQRVDYTRLLAFTGISNLTVTFQAMERNSPGSVRDNLDKWYNILSCIIHATNTDETRLFNENTYRKYFQVIRWEILNIFKIFYSPPQQSALMPTDPRLRSLYTLDRLVDLLYMLELQ